MRFALFTSQARSHKNLLQLIRTWEVLLRRHYCGAKLVLTCRLSDEPKVFEYIRAHHLQHDVLEISGVPSAILAALNMLATISINPTLFEGGFPFTFSEAYSVGTPSVMSSIPAVLEMVHDPALQDAMLFDPYDSESISERVRWALANRSRLLEIATPLVRRHGKTGLGRCRVRVCGVVCEAGGEPSGRIPVIHGSGGDGKSAVARMASLTPGAVS